MRPAVLLPFVLLACNEPVRVTARADPPAARTSTTQVFGAPIESGLESAALAEVAKDPRRFANRKIATSGTISAVCQHAGCWMEMKDDAGEAHIKMAGHAFFIPRTASGKKARVMAKLAMDPAEPVACQGDGHKGKGCRAEAEEQLGRPLAKLELVASGVEILD
jgi:hypothetical protein